MTVHQFCCILHFCHTCSIWRVELVVQFTARGSTQVLLCLFQCQASIYTLSLCRGHSWRVRLAKQETLTPPGHLVLPLVCRGPWMSNVVLYYWCHSDSASVLLYFTLKVVLSMYIDIGSSFWVFRQLPWSKSCKNHQLTGFWNMAICQFVFKIYVLFAQKWFSILIYIYSRSTICI